MKNIVYIFYFLFIACSGISQTTDSLVWSLKGEVSINENEIWTVDVLGNIYVTANTVINKYDSTGLLKFSQSIKSFGRLKDLQVINTMKLIAFSEEQQMICPLDNTLTLSEKCIELSEFTIGNASHIAVSGQPDKIWVVDQLNSRLLLLSLGKTDQFQEIKNLQGILNVSEIKSIQEVDNELFLTDSNHKIYHFDLYGSLIDVYQYENLDCYIVREGTMALLQNGKLILNQLLISEQRTIPLPANDFCEVKISGDYFYFRSGNKILKYTLILRN